MSTDKTPTIRRAVDRRTVTTGLAWSVPAVAATAAAPSFAASLVKNPGINGWVLNSYRSLSGCRWSLTVNSNPSNPPQTDDGAPFGLYLYDTDTRGRYDAAKMVYWIRGNHRNDNPITWTSNPGHSPCWEGPTAGTPTTKSDGVVYTPYTWDYRCEIDPEDVSPDGRLRLGNFHVSAVINQSVRGGCLPLDIWAYREIRVDADGDGPLEPELMHFERRRRLGGGSAGFNRNGTQAAPEAAATGRTESVPA